MSDVQVRFAGDSAGIYHQNFLSSWMIGTRKEEVPMLVPTTETSIIANNQPATTVRNGVIQTPQPLNMPTMQDFVTVTTPYNMGANRIPRRVRKNGIYGSTPVTSDSGTSAFSCCPIPTPPSICIWNGSIGNIGKTTTPNFRETIELHTSIDRIFFNDYNVPSVVIHIPRD